MTAKYSDKIVTLLNMPEEGFTLPAQAEGCMEALRELLQGRASCTQGELVEFVFADSNGSRAFVNTKQSPKRIWDFYRKDLKDSGCITVRYLAPTAPD